MYTVKSIFDEIKQTSLTLESGMPTLVSYIMRNMAKQFDQDINVVFGIVILGLYLG